MARTIVLDLDGTLCLGDAPVRQVALRAFGALPPEARDDALGRLDAFLGGAHVLLPQARDGYDAVALLAADAGLGSGAVQAAFLATRAEPESWIDAVQAPQALLAALAALHGVRRVLVTNSPDEGMDRVLATLGIDAVVDEVVTNAGKPDGMPAILDRLGIARSSDAAALAAVGDRWLNDLAEVHRRGGTTFQIAHDGWADGEATHRARTPDELAPAIDAWHQSM